ncbi:MAG: thiamine pyrophosphate-dependent dehydrogenase E1 component subunit alpha [Chloroflexota bacterium]
MGLLASDFLEMYRWMVFTRSFEQRLVDLHQSRGLPELPHSSIGQEAVGVGACYGLRRDDVVMPSLRTRAAFFVKGVNPRAMAAAIFAKGTGPSRGKMSGHHMGDFSLGVLVGSGILGSAQPLAVGAALACKKMRTDRVVVSFFGDGASNRGDVHEAMNFAAVTKAPIVWVLENNLYAMSLPSGRNTAITDLAIRAASYGFPGMVADGMDVVAVHEAVSEAVQRARAGLGPSLVECKTYRFRGHCELDAPDFLRPQAEIEQWLARCPIKRLERQLFDLGTMTPQIAAEIEADCKAKVDDAMQYAEDSPWPAVEDLLKDVYAS